MFVSFGTESGYLLARDQHSVPVKTERLSASQWVEITDEILRKIIGSRVQIHAHSLDREPEIIALARGLARSDPEKE